MPLLVAAAVVSAGALAIPAMTASNTVPATKAARVPVVKKTFALTAGPTYEIVLTVVTAVSFTVTPAAGSARARVRTAAQPNRVWDTCSSTNGGTTWRCVLAAPLMTTLEGTRTFSWVAVS